MGTGVFVVFCGVRVSGGEIGVEIKVEDSWSEI